MALVRFYPSKGEPVIVPLHKPVTTLGRALDNDVRVADPSVADHHAASTAGTSLLRNRPEDVQRRRADELEED